jgi:ESF2/ABP1 family protein
MSFDDDFENEEATSRFKLKKRHSETDSDTDNDNGSDGNSDRDSQEEQENFEALKPLSVDELAKFQAKVEKTGVCYMSRIPPFMKHTKLRSMLIKYGEIGRIYLNPEDSKISAKRKKYKKNRRVNYTEGWIEFMDKKIARQVAAMLNNTNMGGKKRSYYYDDIWNIKYLPKFKWNNLTEQLAYELKVKEQRLKNEISQAKRENKMYLKNVEKAKAIEAMEKRKKTSAPADISKPKVERKFKQRQAIQSKDGIASDIFQN